MINTKFTYNYRDNGGFSRRKSVVVRGELTADQLQPYLTGDGRFIAEQVGLPSPQIDWGSDSYAYPTDDDHVYCELNLAGFVPTPDEPTTTLTAEELEACFARAARGGWQETLAAEKLGLA